MVATQPETRASDIPRRGSVLIFLAKPNALKFNIKFPLSLSRNFNDAERASQNAYKTQ